MRDIRGSAGRAKDVSPRGGVSYDLFGNGRTALKASLGPYVAKLQFPKTRNLLR